MPEFFAPGYTVGFLERGCTKGINPHLNWPQEQTVGTPLDVIHTAAAPAGFDVSAKVSLVEGRELAFEVAAHDCSI